MSWLTLRVTPGDNRDAVIAALFESGSQGVEETGSDVVTHFPDHKIIDSVLSAVTRADPQASVLISETPSVDNSEWRGSVQPHRVGRFVIAPPWRADEFLPHEVIIVEPAMAFGTGEHQSTRGVMRLMHDVLRSGDVVADLGAGSAVLSIAAIKLGAARVAAIELDTDSIGNAESNLRLNGVEGCVEVIEGDANLLLPLLAPVRVVLANILSSVLTAMLPTIRDALSDDGRAILGGMVLDERESMMAAINESGFLVEREDTEDAWWSVQIALR